MIIYVLLQISKGFVYLKEMCFIIVGKTYDHLGVITNLKGFYLSKKKCSLLWLVRFLK